MSVFLGKSLKAILLSFLLFSYSTYSFSNSFTVLAVDEPPANYINENGDPDGYVVDIINALLKEMEIPSDIHFVPEARAMKIIRAQPNTILISISRTDFRESLYHWVGKVFTKKWEVYALKESNLTINSMEELKELPTIGLVRGDVREEWLINRAFTNLYSVTHHQQNVHRLFLKRVSAIVYENPGLSLQIKKMNENDSLVESVYTINQSSVYITMSKLAKQSQLEEWQKAFNRLAESKELERIAVKWKAILKHKFNIDSEISEQLLVF